MGNYRKKLIEVSLPLGDINAFSKTEKSARDGHPSTLHLWWARRPLAACRSVLFASLIDDPSEHQDLFPSEEAQKAERQRLFGLIREMANWDNINDEKLFAEIRAEINRATDGNPPAVLDPFAGGGSIPLEAQRLGLSAYASDLNPVAVLINKALIEIPPRFAGCPPVNPDGHQLIKNKDNSWQGAQGLAADIRHYGQWMRDEAQRRIGEFYPTVTLPKEQGGSEVTVIAWIWARTVRCPNPSCGIQAPLVNSFWLSKKEKKEAWVEPMVISDSFPVEIQFQINHGHGTPQETPKVGRGGNFKCLSCETIIEEKYVKEEFLAKRNKAKLMAIVAEGPKGRIYLPPTPEQEQLAQKAEPEWKPEQEMPKNPRWFSPPVYGMTEYGDIFSPRQLHALTTLSDLVQEVRARVLADATAVGSLPADEQPLHEGGRGAVAYGDAIATYMALAVDRLAMTGNSLVRWNPVGEKAQHAFGRQALPMIWDFAEPNFFGSATGSISSAIDLVADPIVDLVVSKEGKVSQQDAVKSITAVGAPMISTDPPYYDNIGYADLSDFFYIWLRRSLGLIYPDMFQTMLVPKKQELIATPYRFNGDKLAAQKFFEDGLSKAFYRMRETQHSDFPLTVYYAFKQAEHEAGDEIDEGEDEDKKKKGKANGNGNGDHKVASTGWETMLEGLIRSGFSITGTWPLRTEMKTRQIAMGTNALASSILLVCRPRPVDAPMASRKDFLAALRRELPDALRKLQQGNIGPVDLEQAIIGPGMSIYSRYSQILDSDGQRLPVRVALQLINQALDIARAEQEGEFDEETRFAITWFGLYGHREGPYGEAESMSKAKNMTIAHLQKTGLVEAKAGKVRLRKREELSAEFQPDGGTTAWEIAQRLVLAYNTGGEQAAAAVLREVPVLAENAKDLLYRLFAICDRQKWTDEAIDYNKLVSLWSDISLQAHRLAAKPEQARLL